MMFRAMPPALRTSWGTVRLRVTVAAIFVVTIAMILSSWFLVRAVRTSLREDLRTESGVALNDAYERFQRGESLPIPSPLGFAIVVVDHRGTILGGSPGFADGGRWAGFVGQGERRQRVGANGQRCPGAVSSRIRPPISSNSKAASRAINSLSRRRDQCLRTTIRSVTGSTSAIARTPDRATLRPPPGCRPDAD